MEYGKYQLSSNKNVLCNSCFSFDFVPQKLVKSYQIFEAMFSMNFSGPSDLISVVNIFYCLTPY